MNKFLFKKIEEENIGNIWLQQDGATCHTAEVTLDVFFALFLKIALSAAELMSFGHLGAAIWHQCYVDKPDTIDALEENIREVIGEIQLHTIDNVLKNCTDRVGYCMVSRGSRKDCTFK